MRRVLLIAFTYIFFVTLVFRIIRTQERFLKPFSHGGGLPVYGNTSNAIYDHIKYLLVGLYQQNLKPLI